ncbi:MAG: enoyl-CoA hydratase/isomerase family protein [Bacteroidota bacterium]
MNNTTTGYVRSETVKDGLQRITFYHPKHNSLPSDLLQQLQLAIQTAGEDDKVRVIILQSGGDRTFCAGASFDELIAINDFPTGKRFFMGFANVINALRKCPKLVIGRVQGKAVGGGVGLAAAVDYCMATQYAAVKLSELNVGIGPFVVGPAVERKVGLSALTQLTINADQFQTAAWAQAKGLYADVFDTVEELDAAVLHLADYLLRTNPTAQRQLKAVFWEDCTHWDELLEARAEKSGQLVLSAYTKQTLAEYGK